MKHKNSHLLVGYWSRLRQGRAIPDQSDIDPRAIKRMLSQVFIIEARDPSRPVYRLAGTGLCDRFGYELKGTDFLAHWEDQSALALSSLLKQALHLKQPVCLRSVGATSDCGMVELETILAPIGHGEGEPTRFLGMAQILTDVAQLHGRPIAFQRLAGSQFVREDDPLPAFDAPLPPPPAQGTRVHPKAPHLRLVVSRDKPATLHFDADHMLQTMAEIFGIDFKLSG